MIYFVCLLLFFLILSEKFGLFRVNYLSMASEKSAVLLYTCWMRAPRPDDERSQVAHPSKAGPRSRLKYGRSLSRFENVVNDSSTLQSHPRFSSICMCVRRLGLILFMSPKARPERCTLFIKPNENISARTYKTNEVITYTSWVVEHLPLVITTVQPPHPSKLERRSEKTATTTPTTTTAL